MEFLYAILFGAIQGITEAMPISSSAHLILIPKFCDFPHFGKEFDVFLNLGTLIATMFFLKNFVKILFFGFFDFISFKKSTEKEFFITVFLSSLPAFIVGFIVELIFDLDINSPIIIAIFMIVFGGILFFVDKTNVSKNSTSRSNSIKVGIAQILAFIPGVSRLGASLSMMRFLGYSRKESFEYCMVLSIPLAAGACFLKLIKVLFYSVAALNWTAIFVGCVTSFICCFFSLIVVSKFLEKHTLSIFAIYRIVFGFVIIISMII